MAIMGNTIKLRAEFRDYDGELYDPSTVTLKIYNTNRNQLGSTVTVTDNDRVDVGIYECEYTVPIGSGNLTYEFEGITGSMPVVGRGTIIRSWT